MALGNHEPDRPIPLPKSQNFDFVSNRYVWFMLELYTLYAWCNKPLPPLVLVRANIKIYLGSYTRCIMGIKCPNACNFNREVLFFHQFCQEALILHSFTKKNK